jgi:hypothetical protein
MRRNIILLAAAFCLLPLAGEGKDPSPERGRDHANPLLGTWRMVSYKYDGLNDYSEPPKNYEFLNYFTDNMFCWITYEKNLKHVECAAGGTIIYHQDEFIENIMFGNSTSDDMFVGETHRFKYSIENGKLHRTGTLPKGAKVDEIWVRCAGPPPEQLNPGANRDRQGNQ